MDDRRFDTIIRAFGTGSTRRVVLGGVAASAGGLLAPFSIRSARAQVDCAEGLVDCGGVCVDVASDPANCGGCGAACGEGGSCEGGSCVFAVGSGTCASSCSAPYVQDPVSCACVCPAGLVDCGGICLNVSADPANCGGCGVVCPGGACVSSACACAGGSVPCGDQCVPACGDPLVLDPATCACICPPGFECGADQTFDPATCTCSPLPPTPTSTPKDTVPPEVEASPAPAQTTGAPDATGTAPPTGPDLALRPTVCLETDQDGWLVAASTDGTSPVRMDIARTVTPTGVDVAMRFAETEGAAPFLVVQAAITPRTSARLALDGDGVDYQFELDEATGGVAITTGGQRTSGTFNPATGHSEGLTDVPEFTLPAAMNERVGSLKPAFDTIIGQAVVAAPGAVMRLCPPVCPTDPTPEEPTGGFVRSGCISCVAAVLTATVQCCQDADLCGYCVSAGEALADGCPCGGGGSSSAA